jgi:3',5'-cyclic AMP phosphodiesterase CpdA
MRDDSDPAAEGRSADTTVLSRRSALACLAAWSGAGILWSVTGGVPTALGRANDVNVARAAKGQFTFVQISDTHLGFNKEANPDVVGTLRSAIADINALPQRPQFLIHTGDITHLSKPAEFDQAKELLGELHVDRIHFVPGEHDALDNGLQGYLRHHGDATGGRAYYSFDNRGVHFVGLCNVVDFKPGSLPSLGQEQIEWLEKDLAGISSSTPIVVFAHIPLWTVYEPWGWGTADAAQAMSYLRRFGSVTVLNGHIHQVVQKVEGHITFHTAMSTAYPQPAPGAGPEPGPLKVAPDELRRVLGTRQLSVVPAMGRVATFDRPLVHTT